MAHGFWRSSTLDGPGWPFKRVWNQNDLFSLMNDPWMTLCLRNYRRVILVLSHRLLLLLFLVHNYDFLFISSLSAKHIWCSDTFFHGREGVGHDESSSPVGRCLIRNRPWLWLTDKVIITPLDNPPSPPGRLFFTLRRISDFYDFTPKYIITKLMYMYVYRGLSISLNPKKPLHPGPGYSWVPSTS